VGVPFRRSETRDLAAASNVMHICKRVPQVVGRLRLHRRNSYNPVTPICLFIARISQDYSDAGAPPRTGLDLVHSRGERKLDRKLDRDENDPRTVLQAADATRRNLICGSEPLIVLARLAPEMQDCVSPSAYAEQTALVPKESRDNELRSTEARD